MTDTEGDGDVFDWTFGIDPASYNGFNVLCRGSVSQAIWFYGQIRTKGVFKASGGYPLNRLLDVKDVTVNARRSDNGQADQGAVNAFVARIGAIVA